MTNRSIDPRSGLVFDIREFGHRAGGSKEVVSEVPAPVGIGNDVIGVPTDSPIRLASFVITLIDTAEVCCPNGKHLFLISTHLTPPPVCPVTTLV